MKNLDLLAARLYDRLCNPAFASSMNESAKDVSMEQHLAILNEQFMELRRAGAPSHALADIRLQIARTLVALGRGDEAWPLARGAFETFMDYDEFENATDACNVLYQADHPSSVSALGQGIWLAVTCPVDPELTIDLLSHVIEDTAKDEDSAAVAATTAVFLADVRAEGPRREDLMFFATQMLSSVANDYSGVKNPEQLEHWMEKHDLKEPEIFLVRLRKVVEALVQDDWWFDREALLDRLPFA